MLFIPFFLIGISVGLLISPSVAKLISKQITNKKDDDWELIDAATANWKVESYVGINDKFCWYEIYYSPSRDRYVLEIGGYNPKEHTMYREAVKALRENNEKARRRKEQKKDPIVEHEQYQAPHKN